MLARGTQSRPHDSQRRPGRVIVVLGMVIMLAVWNPLACWIHCATHSGFALPAPAARSPFLCHVPPANDHAAPADAPGMPAAPLPVPRDS